MRGVWRPKSAPGQSWDTDRGFRANACVQNSWKPRRPENRVLAAASSPTHPPTKAHEGWHAEGHQHTLLFLLISVSPFKHPPFPPYFPPTHTHSLLGSSWVSWFSRITIQDNFLASHLEGLSALLAAMCAPALCPEAGRATRDPAGLKWQHENNQHKEARPLGHGLVREAAPAEGPKFRTLECDGGEEGQEQTTCLNFLSGVFSFQDGGIPFTVQAYM